MTVSTIEHLTTPIGTEAKSMYECPTPIADGTTITGTEAVTTTITIEIGTMAVTMAGTTIAHKAATGTTTTVTTTTVTTMAGTDVGIMK